MEFQIFVSHFDEVNLLLLTITCLGIC